MGTGVGLLLNSQLQPLSLRLELPLELEVGVSEVLQLCLTQQ